MRIPMNEQPGSMFMGNYFCVIPQYKMAFVCIAKNSSTFLKSLAVYTKTGIYPTSAEMYKQVGFDETGGYLYSVSQLKELEMRIGSFVKFAVWRDPVERLISCYKFFCLERENRFYFRFLSLYRDNSFGRFMDFVHFELGKSDPLYQDEHIRRQSDYYSSDDVDYIVPINKLNDFLERYNVPLIRRSANVTSADFTLSDVHFIDDIKELYKSDYNLYVNY